MNQMVTPKFGVGAPLRRKEDEPLITGKGIYTGDYMPEGCLHGVVVRSAMGACAHQPWKCGRDP